MADLWLLSSTLPVHVCRLRSPGPIPAAFRGAAADEATQYSIAGGVPSRTLGRVCGSGIAHPRLLEEIASDDAKGWATSPELEESDADLQWPESSLTKIQARDYFDAAGNAEAIPAVAECAEALAEFEGEALVAEIGDDLRREESQSALRAARQLRAIRRAIREA